MSVDLKTLTPDTTINDSAVLFGADSQASSTPSVYAVSTLRTHIVGTANTFTQPQVVSVSSSSNALRITQTGAGNALLVEDSANPDSSPFVIDATGKVIVGSTTASSVPDFNGTLRQTQLSVEGETYQSTSVAVVTNVALTGGPTFTLAKSRGTNAAPNTIVNNNDSLGAVNFSGNDGAAFIRAATITSAVDGIPGLNDMPGRLVFSTTADGTSTPLERMRITNLGNVCIGTTAAGTSAEEVLAIGTGVAPTTGPADTIQIYSTDLSAGNTILSVYTEGAGATNAGITNTTVTNKIAVRINGTVYYLLATTNGT